MSIDNSINIINIMYKILDISNDPVLDNESLFIKITDGNIKHLLEFLDKDIDYSIYNINMNIIKKILNEKNIASEVYKPFYQILVDENKKFPDYLMLAHNKICKTSKNHEYIMTFGSGYIVRSKEENEYKPYSVVYTKKYNEELPEYTLINKKFLSKNISKRGLYMNSDLSSLSFSNSYNIEIPNYREEEIFKLMDTNGNYLTESIINNNKLELKSDEYSNLQKMRYTVDGLLKLNNKCVEANNNEINLNKCNNRIEQKWSKKNNTIKSQADNKCITSEPDTNTIKLLECKNPENQEEDQSQTWTYIKSDEDSINTNINNHSWRSHKGKSVVLVNSDNPWYHNKDMTGEMKLQEEIYPYSLKGDIQYEYGEASSKFILDTTKRNLGLGYSYKDRLGKPCKIDSKGNIVEGFNGQKIESRINKILDVLLIVLIVIIIYILIKKYCKSNP